MEKISYTFPKTVYPLRPKNFKEHHSMFFSDSSYITSGLWEENEDFYIDWSDLDTTNFWGKEITILTLQPHTNGFLINGHLVHCYALYENQSFYSTDLNIVYHTGPRSFMGIKEVPIS